ncbi:PEGA domain-containing protein [Carboxylicivirga marina]|uniref:PEGA domain-containing protein n=1 Tax=Carboxylicivirga marina TaxID=2800988 RepID=A0ABS1HNC9_9BACT|nr:PEGA domain-containing protein [Carboxylicivirga marina]MBK3518674.1 PEGA domain-containing protein [Carboxylicivirga marina]
MNKLTLTFLVIFFTINSFSQEKENKGSFRITTEPSSANVQLVDFPDATKQSPAVFSDYKPILYSIKIEKHNYQSIDTVIHCLPGRMLSYHFDLVTKTGTANIISQPEGAHVYINNQKVGTTPLTNIAIPCGPNLIKLVSIEGSSWQDNFIVDEQLPLLVNHNFSQSYPTNNRPYSTPVNNGFSTNNTDQYTEETAGNVPSGFGTFGIYTMIGSNGAKGTSYRYGADLFGYLRLWGESNKESEIKGFGFEGVLPLDLDKVAFYAKGGLVSRTFEPLNSYGSENITFVTLGGGLSIKPSPHFQFFAEFEFGMYDDEEYIETIDLWEQKYNSFSSASGWVGIRIAF